MNKECVFSFHGHFSNMLCLLLPGHEVKPHKKTTAPTRNNCKKLSNSQGGFPFYHLYTKSTQEFLIHQNLNACSSKQYIRKVTD